MTDTQTRFDERAAAAHALEVARGEHDEHCEHGPREHNGRPIINYICGCSKRRREREGYTEPPGELIYQPPLCPRCDDAVWHNGDVWQCDPCRVTWPGGFGTSAEFFDDYGDLS